MLRDQHFQTVEDPFQAELEVHLDHVETTGATDAVQRREPIGTEPSAQGTGVGAAPLRSRLAECDRDGLPAYLECVDANVPLYERFGFEVISTIQVPDGGPVPRGMWRARLRSRTRR